MKKKVISVILAFALVAIGIPSALAANANYQNIYTTNWEDTADYALQGGTVDHPAAASYTPVDGYDFAYQVATLTYRYALTSSLPKASAPADVQHTAYISGYPDGTFRPDGQITRAEVAAILYNLAGKPQIAPTAAFSDVNSSQWYYSAISYLAGLGIVSGYGNGTFQPNNPITRAEMATVIARYTGISITSPGQFTFTDVKPGDWYYNAVAQLAAKGWLTGYSDGTFAPIRYITRAEAVTIINRMLDRTLGNNQVLTGVQDPFTDLSPSHWAYGNIIEASITHDANAWHGGVTATTAPSVIPYAKVTESCCDLNGNSIAPVQAYDGDQKNPGFTKDGYTYIGYELDIEDYYVPSGSQMGMHGGFAAQFATAYHNTAVTDPAITSTAGWLVPGDTIAYKFYVYNNTDDALSNYPFAANTANDTIRNARVVIELDNTPSATCDAMKRLDFVSITGNYINYAYDDSAKEMTVYLGDVPLDAAINFTVTVRVNSNHVDNAPQTHVLVMAKGLSDNLNALTPSPIAGFGVGRMEINPETAYKTGPLQMFTLFG